MKTILISACLLGAACRYDGCSKPLKPEIIDTLKTKYHLIPVCPEIMGGLPTPRIPAEISAQGRAMRKDGQDITVHYQRGAAEALRFANIFQCKSAILKERSPSCGTGKIYDGSFTNTLTDGNGIASELLQKNGILVIGESEIFTADLL
jgi:uncharacterized protein YbbK (DUF523 family)